MLKTVVEHDHIEWPLHLIQRSLEDFASKSLLDAYPTVRRLEGFNSGMMLIDLWTVGRNSWNWWRSQPGGSYWANAGAPGHSGTDGIHLSDLGHQYVSTVILNALTPNLP